MGFLHKLFGDEQATTESGVMPLVLTKPDDHKHAWELLSKTQAPARRDVLSLNTTAELYEKQLFGTTEFIWECLVCHAHQKEFTLGSETSQLDELIDKTDKYGPQYIQRTDGTTFVLMKYQQPSSALPLR